MIALAYSHSLTLVFDSACLHHLCISIKISPFSKVYGRAMMTKTPFQYTTEKCRVPCSQRFSNGLFLKPNKPHQLYLRRIFSRSRLISGDWPAASPASTQIYGNPPLLSRRSSASSVKFRTEACRTAYELH